MLVGPGLTSYVPDRNSLSEDEYEELQWGEIDNQSEEENSDEEQGAEAGDDQPGEAQGNEREEEHARNEHGEELDLVGAVGLDLEPPGNPVHLLVGRRFPRSHQQIYTCTGYSQIKT